MQALFRFLIQGLSNYFLFFGDLGAWVIIVEDMFPTLEDVVNTEE